MVEGFAGLGEQFDEFAFVVNDVRRLMWEQQAILRVQQERSREHLLMSREQGLMLSRVLEAVQRGEMSTLRPGDAAYSKGSGVVGVSSIWDWCRSRSGTLRCSTGAAS